MWYTIIEHDWTWLKGTCRWWKSQRTKLYVVMCAEADKYPSSGPNRSFKRLRAATQGQLDALPWHQWQGHLRSELSPASVPRRSPPDQWTSMDRTAQIHKQAMTQVTSYNHYISPHITTYHHISLHITTYHYIQYHIITLSGSSLKSLKRCSRCRNMQKHAETCWICSASGSSRGEEGAVWSGLLTVTGR